MNRLTRAVRRLLPAATLLFGGLALSIILFTIVSSLEEKDAKATFLTVAQERFHKIQTNITLTVDDLDSLGDFYDCSHSVEETEFGRYAQSLLRQNKAIQSVEWLPRISGRDRQRFEQAAGFVITARNAALRLAATGERGEYFPVLFVQPLQENQQLRGFDPASDPSRREALQRAVDTGEITATVRLDVVGANSGEYCIRAFRPLYRGADVPRDEDGRRAALRGLVSGVFRVADLVDDPARSEPGNNTGLAIAAFDLQAKPGERLLYPKDARFDAVTDLPEGMRATMAVQVADRTWEIAAYPCSQAFGPVRRSSRLVLMAGILLTLVLTAYLNLSSSRRVAIERTVAERTSELQSALGRLEFAGAAVRRSAARYRALVELSPDAILIARDKAVTAANRAAVRLFQVEREEALVGQTLNALLQPASQETAAELDRMFLSESQTGRFEWQIVRGNGSQLDVEIAGFSFEDDESLTAQAVVRDISDRKRAQAQLVKAKELAEDANRAKSQFLAMMSHEIRTPMNGVIGMAGLLLGTSLTAEQRRYAEVVRASGEHLLGILNDILDFSKIEARKLEFETVDFDLHGLLHDTVEMLAIKAREKGLGLSCETLASVPALLRGDPGRLRQVLVNLIGNAIKFTEHGSVSIRVEAAGSEEHATRLRFAIADTGIGIPADRLDALFSPFVQADGSTTRRHGGTGLGLAISKELVTKMAGQIGVETQLGKGTTFWFTAVFEKRTEQNALPVSAEEKELRQQVEILQLRRGARILVAEDNEINQEVSLAMLQQLGFTADIAADGQEALDALRRADYDLVLMDCEMPVIDGYEATQRIRTDQAVRNPLVPVVALTADATAEVRQRCLACGMNDHLAKPVWPNELAAILIRWLKPNVTGGPADSRPQPTGVTVSPPPCNQEVV